MTAQSCTIRGLLACTPDQLMLGFIFLLIFFVLLAVLAMAIWAIFLPFRHLDSSRAFGTEFITPLPGTDKNPTEVQQRLARVEQTLSALVMCTASGPAPITAQEAESLIKMLLGDQET